MSQNKDLEVKNDVILGSGEEKEPKEVEAKEGFAKKVVGWVKRNGKKIVKVTLTVLGAVTAVGGAYALGATYGLPIESGEDITDLSENSDNSNPEE